MKAAVFTGNRNFNIEDLPFPQVEPDGVIIKIRASGICGSDLHLYRHVKETRMVFGHEFSGDIVELGKNVKNAKVGDRVTAMSGRGCGECFFCRKGDILHCSKLELLGYKLPGAMAEYASVPLFKLDRYAARLPDNVSYQMGATAEPLSVALYAVNQVQPKPADTVVVIGLGIIGLCIVQVLRARGVKNVIASGRRSNRLKLAEESGARIVMDAAKDDIALGIKEMTSGKMADIVFEVAGTPDSFKQSLEIVHRGGKVDVVGLYEQPVTWNPGIIAMQDVTLVGCGLNWDIPGAVNLMENGQVDTRPFITHKYPLEMIKEAYDTQLENREAVKVLIEP